MAGEVFTNTKIEIAKVATTDLAPGAFSVKVSAQAPPALRGGPFKIIIKNEIISVAAPGTSTNWTITRAQETAQGGASAETHPVGTSIFHKLTAGTTSTFIQNSAPFFVSGTPSSGQIIKAESGSVGKWGTPPSVTGITEAEADEKYFGVSEETALFAPASSGTILFGEGVGRASFVNAKVALDIYSTRRFLGTGNTTTTTLAIAGSIYKLTEPVELKLPTTVTTGLIIGVENASSGVIKVKGAIEVASPEKTVTDIAKKEMRLYWSDGSGVWQTLTAYRPLSVLEETYLLKAVPIIPSGLAAQALILKNPTGAYTGYIEEHQDGTGKTISRREPEGGISFFNNTAKTAAIAGGKITANPPAIKINTDGSIQLGLGTSGNPVDTTIERKRKGFVSTEGWEVGGEAGESSSLLKGAFVGVVNKPAAGPSTGAFIVGDWAVDKSNGSTWICTASGSPGTWINSAAGFLTINGPTASGGFLGQSFDLPTNKTLATNETIYISKIMVPVTISVKNIFVLIPEGGGGNSGTFTNTNGCAVYSKGGAKLAETATQATAWKSVGLQKMGVTQFSVTGSPTEWIWIAVLASNSVKAPEFASSNFVGTTKMLNEGGGSTTAVQTENMRGGTGGTAKTAFPASYPSISTEFSASSPSTGAFLWTGIKE